MEQASKFANLALRCIQQEYPNAPGMVFNGPEDLKLPRELHPAFYGSFDWHSAVHGHWMLVRLLNRFGLPEAAKIRAVLNRHLTPENLQTEADYFEQPNRKSFERTYGWAWVLKLAEELRDSSDLEVERWRSAFEPLERVIIERYLAFLGKPTYPIRVGTHPNSAFGLSFAFDYAVATQHPELELAVKTRAMDWFGSDADYPAHLEPGGADFFSPSLMEADLMMRVLGAGEFGAWFERFLPHFEETTSLLRPATVSDRTDPQIAHLDGLNLSRAWCFQRLATALPPGARKSKAAEAAETHATVGLAGVFSGDYAGEHWLASFATYLLTNEVY